MRYLTALMALTLSPVVALAADPAHGEAAAAANPFAGTIYQSVAAIIVFLILFAALRKMAWGPIVKGLQDREEKIKADLNNAEQASKKAAATLEEYRQKLQAASDDAKRMMDDARRDAEKTALQIQEETRGEIGAMKKKAEAEITYAKEQAVAELYAQAATLATTVASKILSREIRPEDQQKLVQESLAELGNGRSN